ncbi:MAG: RNA-binding domain-containing protein [Promethearchaeota archaeon]
MSSDSNDSNVKISEVFHLTISAEINPSEDPEKVKSAILRIFPGVEISVRGKCVLGETTNPVVMENLHQLLLRQQILDAARRIFKEGITGSERINFMIHRQAAAVGRLSFVSSMDESPLGPIEVQVYHTDILGFIDHVAPKWAWIKPKSEK